MRVFSERLKVVSSSKVTPRDEPAPVCSVSFLKTGSDTFNAAAALLRVTVAEPCSVAIWPTELSAARVGAAGTCARAANGHAARHRREA